MRRIESRRQRAGFTLIELMVVMTILALLAGLLLAAIAKFREVGPRVQTKAEIGELGLAVESFKSTYDVKYLPTAFILSNDYSNPSAAYQDSRQYMSKVWPKVAASNALPPMTPLMLDGNQVLVFFLGGVPPTGGGSFFPASFQGNRSGFMNSPTNPFNRSGGTVSGPTTGAQAKGPFFNFKADRINDAGQYLDPYGWPYYYFSAKNGNDYNYFGQVYYATHNSTANKNGFTTLGGYGGIPPGTTLPSGEVVQASAVDPQVGVFPMNPFKGPDGKYIRPDSFQIISAGKDNKPGPGGAFVAGTGDYSPGAHGGDDLAIFQAGPLGSE